MFLQRTALGKMRAPVLLCVLACLCAAAGPLVGADRSCTDLRQFYTSKGFTLSGVPQTEISGRCERKTLNLPALTCANHDCISECCGNINYSQWDLPGFNGVLYLWCSVSISYKCGLRLQYITADCPDEIICSNVSRCACFGVFSVF